MTFLNSALLAALSLGLIPILIHLLNRQRFKQVDFPTLRFLQEMQRQKMRRVRVRQWILLALRTLAILALVFAMARPVLRSEAGLLGGGEARASVALVLDRTLSMSTEAPSGTRYHELQSRAQEILQSLGANDEIQIVWADATPQLYPETPTQHRTLLREAIETSTVTEGGGDLIAAMGAARALLGQSQNLLKEVYVLSDFSGSAWPAELPQSPIIPDDVRLFVVDVGSEHAVNVGVADARITSRLITPGRPVELSYTARNSGDGEVADRIVGVYVDGKRVAQTRVSLRAGESRTEQIRFVPDGVGELAGYVRLEDTDAFSGDDVRRFVLRVPARLNVAVVGADGPARRLTALALDPSGRGESFVHVLELIPPQLEAEDWAALDAIFLVDAPAVSGAFGERITAYLQSGRGVFIAGGPNFDTRAHAAWMQSLGLPAPLEAKALGEAEAHWARVDLDHPLFEGIFQEKPADISPEFTRMLTTTRGASSSAIIEGAGGSAFLIEAAQGRGRALFLTSSPDPEWSSLFRAGVFSPLLTASAAYLAGGGAVGSQFELTIGEGAEVLLRSAEGVQYELTQDASSVRLTAVPVTGGQLLKIPPLSVSGVYSLKQDTRTLRPIVANVPSAESDIAVVQSNETLALLGGNQSTLKAGQNVETAIREGRYGRELWKLFLYLALALLIAEMFIARTPKREVLAPEPA
ncbi:MAG: BatA domain-containing protein [bacterium]|nr:BatA domain-containing protein [bacterium]